MTKERKMAAGWCSKRRTMITLFIFVVLSFLVPVATVTAKDDTDKWTVSIQPYIWFPSIDTTLKYVTLPNGSTGQPEISVDADDLLESLNMAALLTTEFRKGKWSITTDLIYMDASAEDARVENINFGGNRVSTTVDSGSEVGIKSFVATVGGGYQVIDEKYMKMDVIAGFRYLWLEAELDWNLTAAVTGPSAGQTFARTGSHSEDGDVWNGIVGVKGRFQLGNSNWFIPFYADIGAGDSDLTWQVFSALGYSFGSWDIKLGYRHMEFDSDEDALIENLSFSGPIIGAQFRF
jgi:hypothetical protein